MTMNRYFLLFLTLLLATPALTQAQRMPVTTTDDDARTHFEQGRDRMAHADFDGAREHLDAALAADSMFGLAHMYRAAASPVAEREGHMRQASAAAVTDGERQLIASYAAHVAGDHEREIALLKKVAEQFPDDPHPPFNLAFELYNLERYDEAIWAFQQAIAIDASFAGAYNGLGYAAMKKGDDTSAERAFRDYIRVSPNEANPYDSMGEFYMLRGRLDEAAAQFEMALERDPDFIVSSNNLVRIGIERSDLRFEQAVAAGDADALAALYTRTGRLLPPNEAAVDGRDAIRAYWAGFIASGINGIDLTTAEVYPAGDTATQISTWTVSVDGQVVDSGRATIVWAKVGDEWLYHRDMWSSDRAPDAVPGSN